MEIVTISVLSAMFLNIFGVISYFSYMYYKRRTIVKVSESTVQSSNKLQSEQKKNKTSNKKKQKKAVEVKRKSVPKRPPRTDTTNDSDSTETLEQQLAQTIMSQQFTHDIINTTAVNAKPTIKKLIPANHSEGQQLSSTKSKHKRKGIITKDTVYERDEDWSNVISKKHKKKLYRVTQQEADDPADIKYGFILDEEGGIVEIPMCEISFPAESVTRPMQIHMRVEKYKKFVDDTEEKVYLTPAIHFCSDEYLQSSFEEPTKLSRQFTLTVNTKKMIGRGWDGNVCCQIEKQESDDTWVTTGRTEYLFGKPVKIVSDELGSYRAVLTRGQNGAITRDLRVAAYIARPKVQNPEYHFIHLCIFDRSNETEYKVENIMQKYLLKMEPRDCNVPFGSDLQFRIKPTQKYSPDERDVFMRWTEICKAFVNVHFQIKLTKNELDDPNFEAEYRTLVFLDILKVSPNHTLKQSEYFHFYWISAVFYPKRKNKKQLKTTKDGEKVSEDDGFASGSESTNTDLGKTTQNFQKSSMDTKLAPITQATTNADKKRRKRKKKTTKDTAQISSTMTQNETSTFKKPLTPSPALSEPKSAVSVNVQSSVTSLPNTANKKPPQMKHGSISANQKVSSNLKNQNLKSGTTHVKPQSNKVQSKTPTVRKENSNYTKTNKPQKSSTTEMSISSKSSISNSNKNAPKETSESSNQKPFKKVFRYRSPSKKQKPNSKSEEPHEGASKPSPAPQSQSLIKDEKPASNSKTSSPDISKKIRPIGSERKTEKHKDAKPDTTKQQPNKYQPPRFPFKGNPPRNNRQGKFNDPAPVKKSVSENTNTSKAQPRTTESTRQASSSINDLSQHVYKDMHERSQPSNTDSQGSKPQNLNGNGPKLQPTTYYNRYERRPNYRKSSNTNGHFPSADPSPPDFITRPIPSPKTPPRPRQQPFHQNVPRTTDRSSIRKEQNYQTLPNGSVETSHPTLNGVPSSPKERRQRQPRDRRKGRPAEANHIESQSSH